MLRFAYLALIFACGGHPTPPPATSGSGGGDCEPGRCLENISEVVGSHKTESRACYDKARQREPKLGAGRVIINFSIDKDGAVLDATQGMQEDQLQDEQMVSCLAELVKSIKFAKSAKGKSTRAYHRFEFSP